MPANRLYFTWCFDSNISCEKLHINKDLTPERHMFTNQIYHFQFELMPRKIQRNLCIDRLINISSVATISTEYQGSCFIDYLPPVLLSIGRALISPKFKRLIIIFFRRGKV